MPKTTATEKYNESRELDSYWIGAELSDSEQYSKSKFRNSYQALCCQDINFSRTRRNFTLVQVSDIVKILDAFKREKSARITRVRLALCEANHRRSVAGKTYRINYRELAKLTNLSNVSVKHLRELVTHARTGAVELTIEDLCKELKLTYKAVRTIPRAVLKHLASGKATRAEIGVLLSVYLRQMQGRLQRSRVSYKQITRLTGLSSRSISRAFLKLKEKRLVLGVAEHNKLVQYNGKAYCLPKPERVSSVQLSRSLGVGQLDREDSAPIFTPRPRRKRKVWSYKKQCVGWALEGLTKTYFFVKPSTKVKRQITHTLDYPNLEQAACSRTARRVPDIPKMAPPTLSGGLCSSGTAINLNSEDRAKSGIEKLREEARRLKRDLHKPGGTAEQTFKPMPDDEVAKRKALLMEQVRRLKGEA